MTERAERSDLGGMQGRKDGQGKLYYQFSLDRAVPEDNYYRRLKRELDLSWVRKETARFYGTEGHKSIDPEVFIKVLLVGYLNNIGSDRRLMQECSNRLDVRLFLGYDIDEELPWHSTISRTRQLWGEDVFLRLFRQVLSMCVSKGMVRGRRQAMDAAPFKANASMDSLLEKEIEDDVAAYADEFDAGSEHRIKREEEPKAPRTGSGQARDGGDPGPTVNQYRKRRVEAHHRWKEEAYKGQPGGTSHTDEHGNLIRGRYLSNHTHHSPTDPDARISVKPGKARQLNYHAQVAVDDAGHVITCAMAVRADRRDSQVLPELVDATMDNLSQYGLHLQQVLADAGYSSGAAMRHCQTKGIEAYIPTFGQYKPEREGFIYNEKENRYECIQEGGHRAHLPFKKTEANHDGHIMHKYRSSSKDCGTCPLRAACIGRSDFKTMTHSVDKDLYDTMYQRMQADRGRRMMRRRSSTVEPVLGTLVNFTNMRRVNTRGLAGANKHVIMAALTYNLKKYLATPFKKVKVIPLEIRTVGNALIKGLSGLFQALFPHIWPTYFHLGRFS